LDLRRDTAPAEVENVRFSRKRPARTEDLEARPVALRKLMVERDIAARGVYDGRVLAAMERIPRHCFVPASEHQIAYADSPLPIGFGQTISQPYIVALMTEALKLDGTETVLEIGTGSGYQTAVLAVLARSVYSIEIVPELAARARAALTGLGLHAEIRVGDGTKGWPEAAPFDAIILTAAPVAIPAALLKQLALGGRLVAPVGSEGAQELVRIVRGAGGDRREPLGRVRFVPMLGAAFIPEALQ